jgi:hypothetical protein
MLTAQPYSWVKLHDDFFGFYSALGLPLAVSAFWSIWQSPNRQARVIAFYFFSSLLIGVAFAGGSGVSANTFFDNLFAMSIIMGACLDSFWKAPILGLGKGGRWRFLVPVLLYSCVLFTFVPWGGDIPRMLSEFPSRQKVFHGEVSFLAAQPGRALCESLILCYDAGKERILYSFGVASLVRVGKLNTNELVNQIAEKKYGAIQTYLPVTQRPYAPPEMGEGNSFPEDVLDAIHCYYREAFTGPDCHIYVPRVEPKGSSNPR